MNIRHNIFITFQSALAWRPFLALPKRGPAFAPATSVSASLPGHKFRNFSLRSESPRRVSATLAVISLLVVYARPVAAANIDMLIFGDSASEQAHGLTALHSDAIRGGLEEPAR